MTCRPTPQRTLTCCLIITLASATSPQAADFGPWMATYELSAKSDVAINPDRLYHGPAAVVAPNGDWLVCFQDSADHGHWNRPIAKLLYQRPRSEKQVENDALSRDNPPRS